MKFTLKDYQDGAVRDVLRNLAKARKRWHEDHERHAFSLTAPTGAGKTVMAAAVFEALFHGDENYDFDADSGAIVIWFSDDPSLNEQTRFRLMESSDRLRHTDLVVVENTFSRRSFEPGKIYFLNTQKLGKNSLLVRGFESEEGSDLFHETRPDAHAFTIWDTIRNTIEDPTQTVYLVLDEAHRGMGAGGGGQRERSTLVKRLINGENGVPGIPVVLGISATVERFNKEMEGAKGRTTLSAVEVDAARVRESGLLKDTIILDIPDEQGRFDTVLIRRAAVKLKEVSDEWAVYARDQDDATPVVPLLVLQVPNAPNHADIGHWLETIFQCWPALPNTCVANVFGEHAKEKFGKYDAPYISPEHVQDNNWVRILVAKDAISTGWDCPRAEVMVSLRRAVDRTHITQLLGRMVRTPLARRIPGNERLNAVDCLLPYFDEGAVKAVVDSLVEGNPDTPPVGRVLINPRLLRLNPTVPDSVWSKFESLPSQTRPQHSAKPAVRLTALAQELAYDEILLNAGKIAHAEMHKVLDTIMTERAQEFKDRRASVEIVEGRTFKADLRTASMAPRTFVAEADGTVLHDAYRRAARILSSDIARSYTEYRADLNEDIEIDFETALTSARHDIAAIGLLENVQILFDREADKLSSAWLSTYRDKIRKLADERQEAYRQIIGLSTEPQDIGLVRPQEWIAATMIREKSGQESTISTYEKHLVCDDQGLYPVELNQWELKVLLAEMRRPGFKFWYRNPARPSQDSLGVAYHFAGQYNLVRPDFLFFAEESEGKVVVDIVDPHGAFLADSLPKLQGLALYAEKHSRFYRRIESVAEFAGKLRVLDLTNHKVREAIGAATDALTLFSGELARDY